MHGYEGVVALFIVVVATAAIARKIGMLAPILLVLVGIGLSYVPGFGAFAFEPEIILVGILPPLLYVAALETSVPAFRYNLSPILLLAIGLVLFTTALVGLSLNLLLGAPLAVCLAVGAVVAPPDAVAATSVARRIGLPRRLVTILEGESLINDATALVTLRLMLAVAAGGSISAMKITETAAIAVLGGSAIGFAGAFVLAKIHKRITNPLLDNAVSLLAPYLVFLPAERIHASGVVAVVVTGLYLGHRKPTLMSAASRLQMGAFWRMVKFLLEGVVFLLVGLQLPMVLKKLDVPWRTALGTTLAVVLIVIGARFVWLYPATYLFRLPFTRRRDPAPPASMPTVVAWAGMRGAVTLAAALALPATIAGDKPYPRGLFILIAFAVIVATLVVQGMTLPAVARLLKVPGDDEKEDALAAAAVQHEASRAAREKLDAEADGAPASVVERLQSLVESRSNLAWERLGRAGRETPSAAYARLRREMLLAERAVFRRARDTGRIPEEVLRRAQHDMDLEESLLERGDS